MRTVLEKENLTTIEWKVYNYIISNSESGKWTSQDEIVGYLGKENITICKRVLRKYISEIRDFPQIQKILLTDYSKGYKFMTKPEEENCYLDKRKIAILKMLKKYQRDVKRLRANGQERITFTDNERCFIESVLKEVGNE